MSSKKRSVVLALLVPFAALTAQAQELELRLDTARAEVTFTLDSTLHKVHGSLHLDSGVVRFDPTTGLASGEIVFDATRTETGNAKRDKKMHRKVLESETYPRIVFTPQRIDVGDSDETSDLSGEITVQGVVLIHGDHHPLTLDVRVVRDGGEVSATMSFAIPYVDWGMHDPSAFVLRVAKKVEVTVTAVGVLTDGKQSLNGT